MRSVTIALAISLLTGCDQVFGFSVPPAPPDGPVVLPDGDVAGQRFGDPRPLVELNSASDDARPSLTDDQLELYFARDGDIYRSRRASQIEAWGGPEVVVELSTLETEASPCVTGDGLTMYVSRVLTAFQSDIFVTTRATTTDAWGAAVALPSSETIPPGVNTLSASEHCGWQSSSDTRSGDLRVRQQSHRQHGHDPRGGPRR